MINLFKIVLFYFFKDLGMCITLVCKDNLFQKYACNPKHLYIKADFPIRNNGNSDDSFHDPKIFISKWLQYCNVIQNNKENKKYEQK